MPPRNPFGASGPRFDRVVEFRMPAISRRIWIGIGFVLAAILVVVITAPLVRSITSYEWFSSLSYGGEYETRVLLQTALFFVGLIVAFLFALANVAAGLRLRGSVSLRALGIRRRVLRTWPGVLGMGAAALVALIMALTLHNEWSDLILFLHPVATGIRDPVFHADVSFYLVSLPFLLDIHGWLQGLTILTLLIVLVMHAWTGDHFDPRLTPRALAHVSVLLAVLALVGVFGSWLDRFSYVYGTDGVVQGAGYTDVHARIPLTTAFVFLNLLVAAVLVANVRFRLGRVILGCGGAVILASIVVAAYPALVQTIAVKPAELSQEKPYIQREIAFTRDAYGLDGVQSHAFAGDQPVTAAEVAADQTTIDNLRLWDYQPLRQTYQQLQSIRTYYTFNDIDLDRYTIDGQYEQVEISAREMDTGKLPPQAQSWVNQRLAYTHGYGVAASLVSKVQGEGLPDYVAENIPSQGPLKVTQPQIYFGQLESSYVLAPSAQPEFDYPSGAANVHNSWTGTDAPKLDGFNRALWSLRTGDFNMLVSSQIQSRTRILYDRNVLTRVQDLAPFLTLDSDPYMVVVNGKLYWMVNAMVTSDTYPYSQQYQSQDGQLNYIRNSVKVVVDAYTGAVSFYISDPQDPIIRSYASAFPGMFHPLSQMPEGLQAHLQVPESLFSIQSSIYATYHISDPATLYNREDVWSEPLDPYYVMMRLPGQTRAEYLLIIPYTPLGKGNLVGWLAVRQDAPHYGQMVSFVLPKDRVVFGPEQVASRIAQTPQISQDYTLFSQRGSTVIRGNLLVVPIGNSFLYFQPWYLEATGQQSLPELKRVILTSGSTSQTSVAYQNNLQQAISQLVGQSVSTSGSGPPAGSAQSTQIEQLDQQALLEYQSAQAALERGDFTTYAQDIGQVGSLLQQISKLEKATPAPQPSPSPSPARGP
ncbi:MAG TPA: UPF0182 family protein [Candidatus Dormibacteraeota bacterium]|jgi:hypothetical protein|nr:UPF0182 family protein [Candidatus Dormibacteraeota bacterium]